MFFDQHEFDVRCEWGESGIAHLAPNSDAIVIVDVMSFCTSVDIAVAKGAVIYPYRRRDGSEADYARSISAILANRDREAAGGYSLAPTSLLDIPAGTRLVLPSPNGSTLTLSTGDVPTFAGCLRNARAVAAAAHKPGRKVSVIPAGERWPGGDLRPAIEDLIGAGAIIHYLPGRRSSEAAIAEAAFMAAKDDILSIFKECSSGKELIGKGFAGDVDLAAMLDVSDCVPAFIEGAYRQYIRASKTGEHITPEQIEV